MYLHVTFGGIFTIQQGLISCPLHWETTLKISAEVDVILLGLLRIYEGKHEYVKFTTTRIVENSYTEYHVTQYPIIFVQPLFFAHKYFPAAHLWPSQNL